MNIERLNLNLLRALDALLTESNVSRAAEKCFITQSAMSNALNQLRSVLNDELLVRSPKGMTLTTKARTIQPKLHHLIAEMAALLSEEPVFNPLQSKRIFKLGMSDIAEFLLLPILLKKLEKVAPHIQLYIQHVNHVESHDIFTRGEIELAVGTLLDKSPYLMHMDCLEFTGVVIARKDHPLMQKKITLKEYLDAKHIRTQLRSELAQTNVDTALTALGKKRDVRVTLQHITPVFFLLQNTDMIGTIPTLVAQSILKKLCLASQPLPFKMPYRKIYVAWSKENDSDPGLMWLRKIIAEVNKEAQKQIKEA